MRILLLTNVFPSPWHPTKGTFNFELARALAVDNEVQVVTPVSCFDEWHCSPKPSGPNESPRIETRDRLKIHYPRYYYTPKVGRRWYHEFLWQSLKSTLRGGLGGFRPQAVLGYWTHPDGTVAVRYAREIGAVAFVMVGGSDVLLCPAGSTRRRLVSSTLQAADGVITVSRDLQNHVIELGAAPERVHVVYRGVDRTRFFPGDRFEARKKLGLPQQTPIFLWVGRMVPVKGLQLLMYAADNLRQRGCRFELLLAGDGTERCRTQRLVDALGLNDCVRFIGKVSHADLPDLYRAADWTVLTSQSEGVPNVLLESHACGTPFIATRVGGVGEIAIAGVDRVVAPGDSGGFGDRMSECLAIATNSGKQLASHVPGLDATAATISALLELERGANRNGERTQRSRTCITG